jgi:enamine deaminase RidA (YjgF/YER057c/UK114 family)
VGGHLATRQTDLNLLAGVQGELGTLNCVERIVKLNGYADSAPGFDQQPAVINGASEVMVAVFGDRGVHARTSIGVSELPGEIPVEIEIVVQFRLSRDSSSS